MKMDRQTDDVFTTFLLEKAAEAKKELKYNPSYFLGMLNSDGAYATVNKLLSSKTLSDGFTKLWEGGRLDLSIEALVLETEWGQFFDEQLLEQAEYKLKQVGYAYKRYEAGAEASMGERFSAQRNVV